VVKRAGLLLLDVAFGCWYGIPPCCIARFTWDYQVKRRLPAVLRGLRFHEGPVPTRRDRVYVPCGWIHATHEHPAAFRALREGLGLQW
jgi:hypothetical protein